MFASSDANLNIRLTLLQSAPLLLIRQVHLLDLMRWKDYLQMYQVTCALATVDLSLTKTVALTNDVDSSGSTTPGDEIAYNISVVNNDASQIASGVEVIDDINTLTGVTFDSSSSTKASPPNP